MICLFCNSLSMPKSLCFSARLHQRGVGLPSRRKSTNFAHAGGETPPLQGIFYFLRQHRNFYNVLDFLRNKSALNQAFPSGGRWHFRKKMTEGARVQNKICASSKVAHSPSVSLREPAPSRREPPIMLPLQENASKSFAAHKLNL